jgi:hypothetical protein
MSSEEIFPAPIGVKKSPDTPIVQREDGALGQPAITSDHPTSSNLPQEGEEQALESHEVIELQKFSERKAWIEEKIKVTH